MIQGKTYTVHIGSNLDILPTLPDNSVDSIVTDPPYGLSDNKFIDKTLVRWISGERDFIPDGKGFMGKSWDAFVPPPALWDECLRVLKPGGHLLAFFGSRTQDIGALSIRLAGFEIRDSIAWMYGSGFPKSLDISKAIDKAAGAEREVVGTWKPTGKARLVGGKNPNGIYQDYETATTLKESVDITAPSTPEAQQWEGWGTALKPAFEPIVVARKPIEGTVANNVLKWGTGGLNIDGSRIGTQEGEKFSGGVAAQHSEGWDRPWKHDAEAIARKQERIKETIEKTQTLGRWPSNVILDPYTAELLDEQSGEQKSGKGKDSVIADTFTPSNFQQGLQGKVRNAWGFGDTGGASRFFYVAKASKRDRNEGLEDIEGKEIGAKGNGLARTCAICGASILNPCECPERTFVNPTRQNFHPTVKPTDLMRYLVKLVTPPGGTVLDPFTGSGSTGKAAILEGFRFIGCELTEDYIPIIEGRLAHAERLVAELKEKEDEALF